MLMPISMGSCGIVFQGERFGILNTILQLFETASTSLAYMQVMKYVEVWLIT